MSPDSEYILSIMYTTKFKIDLCNFLAIWAVLSILLDTQSNELQYVKILQHVVDDYYDKCPTDVMSKLEQQTTDIMNVMYDSVTNDNLIEFQMILIEFQVRLITFMIRQTLTMNKCPMTMIMNICPMTMTMILPWEK